MELLKKGWAWIAGAFGILVGLLYWNRTKRIAAEARVALQDVAKKDHELEVKRNVIEEVIAEDEELLRRLKDEQKSLDPKDLSPDQVEEFWSKHLKK
jgi:hypothetical protein